MSFFLRRLLVSCKHPHYSTTNVLSPSLPPSSQCRKKKISSHEILSVDHLSLCLTLSLTLSWPEALQMIKTNEKKQR
jgi:hypothetical protein